MSFSGLKYQVLYDLLYYRHDLITVALIEIIINMIIILMQAKVAMRKNVFICCLLALPYYLYSCKKLIQIN